MYEPKNLSVRDLSASIHLSRPPASCLRNVIGEAVAKRQRSIGAASVHDDDLGGGRDGAQMLEERADNWRFIQDRDNNRNQHGGLAYYFAAVLCMLNRTCENNYALCGAGPVDFLANALLRRGQLPPE